LRLSIQTYQLQRTIAKNTTNRNNTIILVTVNNAKIQLKRNNANIIVTGNDTTILVKGNNAKI